MEKIKNIKSKEIKGIIEELNSIIKIQDIKVTKGVDYYKNRYYYNFTLFSSDDVENDYTLKIDFEKNYKGHYLEIEEMEKSETRKETEWDLNCVGSKVVSIFELDKYKSRIVLKEAKRDSSKIRTELLNELLKELKPFYLKENGN